MQNLRIEEISERHISDIVKLEGELFDKPYSWETLSKELRLPFSFGFVAINKKEVVGYCLFWIVQNSCEIHRIGVKKEFQGKGVGKTLLREIVEICREKGINEIFLEVSEKNEKAISLYKSFNFEIFQKRENYYRNENALLMKLNVGGKDA